MKLPNSEKALVSKEKLSNYLLSETHPVGGSKAKFFRRLGLNETNLNLLTKSLLKIARKNEVKGVRKIVYGTNYMIEGEIDTPSGKKVRIITVWFTKTEKMKHHGLTPVVSSSFKRLRSLVLTLRVRKIFIRELMLVVLRFVAINLVLLPPIRYNICSKGD